MAGKNKPQGGGGGQKQDRLTMELTATTPVKTGDKWITHVQAKIRKNQNFPPDTPLQITFKLNGVPVGVINPVPTDPEGLAGTEIEILTGSSRLNASTLLQPNNFLLERETIISVAPPPARAKQVVIDFARNPFRGGYHFLFLVRHDDGKPLQGGSLQIQEPAGFVSILVGSDGTAAYDLNWTRGEDRRTFAVIYNGNNVSASIYQDVRR